MKAQLFDPMTLSDTEKDILVQTFGNPVVQKYLRGLAQQVASDVLSTTSLLADDAVTYKVKHAVMQGSISTLLDLVALGLPSNT